MGNKYSEKNDYNPQLYTADRDDFCKSCYSTANSRAGCLLCIVWALGLFLLFSVLRTKVFDSTVAAVVTVVAGFLIFAAYRLIKRRKNN